MDVQNLIEGMQLDLMVKGAADAVRLRPQAAALRERVAGSPLIATVDELNLLLSDDRVGSSPCLYETLLERLEALNQTIGLPGAVPLPLLSYDFDIGQRVLSTFIDEANEHLDGCEKSLLALERQPGDMALVDDLFRDFHSLKGETATVGLIAMRGIAHVCEDLLHRVRSGGGALSGSETDHLLNAVDLLRSALTRVAAHVADASQALPVMPPTWLTWRLGPSTQATPSQRRSTALHAVQLPPPALAPKPEAAVVATPAPRLVVKELTVADESAFPAINPATGVWLLAQAELGEVLASADRSTPVALHHDGTGVAEESAAQQAVRVPVERIDVISGQLATALVLAQQLDLLSHREGHGDHRLDKPLEQLTSVLRQLQSTCLSLRLVKVADTFSRVRRTARDIARQLGKQIEVHLAGEEVELDKTILDGLAAPLMHLVRNALDHGLESPAERRAAGKSETGRLALEARREGGRVVIEIAEDGRGLNLERIRARALEIGLLQPQQQQPTREELIALIFLPGFSTAKEISELSGRGVGMDVVRQAVQKLGGTVTVRTDTGKFTSFLLHLPVSLALQETLLVRVGEHDYLLPQTALAESVRLRGARLGRVQRLGLLLDWRGTAIPLLCLHDFAGGFRQPEEGMSALIVRHGAQHFALAVDEVLGMRQVLIRPLGEALSGLRGFIGGSLMEDGRILLVLDPLDAMRAILGRGFGAGPGALNRVSDEPASASSA